MNMINKPRVLVLGAGFGGLELSTLLSETLGDGVDVTLIDKSDAFVFGYSKLDVMFGQQDAGPRAPAVPQFPASRVCASCSETVTAIDPGARRVTTDGGTYEADYLVVALGADYDIAATPGLAERQRILFGGRSGAAARRVARLHAGKGADRGVRRAVQMPAGAERVRLDAARLSGQSRCPRSLRDHAWCCRCPARCRPRPKPRRR